jgi:hypothetical protein
VILLGVGAVSCLALRQRAPQRDAAQDSPPAEDVRPAVAEASTPGQAGLA